MVCRFVHKNLHEKVFVEKKIEREGCVEKKLYGDL